MKIFFVACLSVLLLAVLPTQAAPESRLDATSGALITAQPGGWSSGVVLQRDRREFKVADDLLALDVNHALFRLGTAPLPFLSLRGEIGISEAESDSEKGEAGLQWGVGAYARLLDLPIESSPVVGLKKSISIGVDLEYTSCESNFDEVDFNWTEWRVNPLFSYTSNRRGEARWFFYDPQAVAVRAGPVFISSDGDYGEQSLEENRNFGGRVVFDLLWEHGWVTRLDGTFLSADEREIALVIEKNF